MATNYDMLQKGFSSAFYSSQIGNDTGVLTTGGALGMLSVTDSKYLPSGAMYVSGGQLIIGMSPGGVLSDTVARAVMPVPAKAAEVLPEPQEFDRRYSFDE